MKIALVCPASLPATQFGGIMHLCLDIAKETSQLGHDVTIYTTDMDLANNAHTFNKKLPRVETVDKFKINRSHVWFYLQLFFVNPGIYSQISKGKPDIIHTIGVRSFQSLVAALISRRKRIPLVLTDQGGLTTHPDISASFVKKLLYKIQLPMIRFIINQSSMITIGNEYERKIFSEFCSNSKLVLVRNGIDLEKIHTGNTNFKTKYDISSRYILFVGRFAHVKGVDVLIRAFASIKNEPTVSNIKLVIMGVDFGFETEMIKMINGLKITDRTIIIKKPPREDVLAAYAECQFLVLPSRWELSPLTPLEGFAFKKPTISTTAHGIPYTVKDGQNAILVESDNTDHLAKAILKLLTDEKTRLEYGENGYRLVHDVCNSKIMAQNTLQVYKDILRES